MEDGSITDQPVDGPGGPSGSDPDSGATSQDQAGSSEVEGTMDPGGPPPRSEGASDTNERADERAEVEGPR